MDEECTVVALGRLLQDHIRASLILDARRSDIIHLRGRRLCASGRRSSGFPGNWCFDSTPSAVWSRLLPLLHIHCTLEEVLDWLQIRTIIRLCLGAMVLVAIH
ncbi:unnamed protein product [Symbiodinium sp. KB8]|nr:unnamed protein product [Symbiodinium sp. KB8]